MTKEEQLYEACVSSRRMLEALAVFETNPLIKAQINVQVQKLRNLEQKGRVL